MIELKKIKSNFEEITIGKTKVYFSYETPIAFSDNGNLLISKNIWSSTTGKHLNLLSRDKKVRLDNNLFKAELESALNKYMK